MNPVYPHPIAPPPPGIASGTNTTAETQIYPTDRSGNYQNRNININVLCKWSFPEFSSQKVRIIRFSIQFSNDIALYIPAYCRVKMSELW